jgi:hypothetical protein
VLHRLFRALVLFLKAPPFRRRLLQLCLLWLWVLLLLWVWLWLLLWLWVLLWPLGLQ